MRTPRPLALLVVLAICVAAAGWLLLRDPGGEPGDPVPVPRAAEPSAPDPVVAEPVVPPPLEEVVVGPPPVESPAEAKPEEAPPAYLYPEQLQLEIARWEDVPAKDVLLDVARQARLEMVIPGHVLKMLENKRVTLDLENTTGAYVIGMVLLPYELSYTVRDGAVHIFVDDD